MMLVAGALSECSEQGGKSGAHYVGRYRLAY